MSISLRTNSKDGLSTYRKHHLYSIILEALVDGQYYLPQNLFYTLTTYINEEIRWNATIADINTAVTYLTYIGMVEVKEDTSLRITKTGLEALADCRFQQLASTTFFNYRSMKNNEIAIIFALFSLVVSLAALVIPTFK